MHDGVVVLGPVAVARALPLCVSREGPSYELVMADQVISQAAFVLHGMSMFGGSEYQVMSGSDFEKL